MQYFNNLPKVYGSDYQGNAIVLTNLLTRINVIPSLLTNPLLFYQYVINDGETPEIIAQNYYGTVDEFWLVMLSAQLMDPQWDWPLNSKDFNSYITDKYQDFDPYSTIYGKDTHNIMSLIFLDQKQMIKILSTNQIVRLHIIGLII